MKIKESHFVITGGNRGIGLAVAEMAAKCGANVYIAARSLDTEIESKLKKLGAASIHFLKCDLSTREGVQWLAESLKDIHVDFLFNNAGLLTGGLIEEQPLDEIYSMFQVNVNALVHLTRSVIPGMIKRGRGKIINNASVAAFMHFPCASTYAASKAAVVAFTDCIEVELRGTGVSTLCLVTPGIKTRMFDEIETKYGKNFEIPEASISPEAYALKIKSAIESDDKDLLPDGITSIGLWTARYLNPLFRTLVKSKFQR
ncbi:SDR family NAD(P)-dependent oxidoreductase [Bdellovibrio sp. HCB337]|uniref:SDR family NAD(P)-dependent oxidoreductase n=1 Tax=Bdellovibrio sp. HCB337 TaxID=3394358 RepID=UPI0039A50BD6